MNLVEKAQLFGKGEILYVYDANGVKLKKIVNEGSGSKTILYLGAAVFEDDKLQFFSTEEGRARINADSSAVVYDYMLKDHLGNVWMVLTEETRTDMYPAATMETASATIEESFYNNIAETRSNTPAGWCVGFCPPNYKVAKVNGSGYKIGPSILLKVMAGDKFNLTANSYWNSVDDPDRSSNPTDDILSVMGNNVAAISGGHFTSTAVSSSSELLGH